MNKYDEYPIGHPQRILSNFDPDLTKYFGMMKCKVSAPPREYFPVLPMKMHGKLMFPLCVVCAAEKRRGFCEHLDADRCLVGTWCTPELKYAVENGYKITEVYEVWHWDRSVSGLFAKYIDTFLIEKLESSGWPSSCVTEEEKGAYVRKVKVTEGIELNPDRIEVNPGRRASAKLMLNSMWGKFGSRDTLSTTKFITNPSEYFGLLNSKSVEIQDIHVVSQDCVMVTSTATEDFNEGNSDTNLAIAAFTTCHARLRLGKMMRQLGERVLYHDTGNRVDNVNEINVQNMLLQIP